ncbi:kinase-like domain-containing protein [Mycena epipterygia]|nr:kinase-like domain-containing protein [Mycena epipterygia]
MSPGARFALAEDCLGIGKHSRVVAATDRHTKSTVAIKIMPRTGPSSVDEADFQHEIRVLTRLMQLPRSSVAYVLHENGIIHTDLHPDNIMFLSAKKTTQTFYGLDDSFHDRTVLKSTEIRIIDFGCVDEDATNCEGLTGTSGYQAPEVIMEWKWTNRVDHFAIGCIIAEMITHQPLVPRFSGTREETLTIMDTILGPFPDPLKATIEEDIPSLYGFDGWILSGRAVLFLDIAKKIKDQIEDADAAARDIAEPRDE